MFSTIPDDFTCAEIRGPGPKDALIVSHALGPIFRSLRLAEHVKRDPLIIELINEREAFLVTQGNFVTVDFIDIGYAFSTV